MEFITLVSSEANEISEKESKKTIACEHVTAALKELGFEEYVNAVQDSADEFKRAQAVSVLLRQDFMVFPPDALLLVAREEAEQARVKWPFSGGVDPAATRAIS